MMLRAKRITPAGWMRVRRELSGGDISVPSKPMMRSWPICLWRSEVILVAIRDRARFLKKYLAPLELSGFPVTHGLRRGLYSCAASRLLVTNDQRATLGREPHSDCFFNSASKFSAS